MIVKSGHMVNAGCYEHVTAMLQSSDIARLEEFPGSACRLARHLKLGFG